MSFNEVAIADLGQIVTGKTPSTKNAAFFDGNYQFVTPSDLGWKTYYCQLTERTVTEDAKKAHFNQFIPAGAVMVTCIGNTIGKCGISAGESLTNQQINTIVPNEGISRKFVYYLLIHNVELIRGIGLGGGSATPILNKSAFSRIRLRVPPRRSWESIASILSAYDDLIENNRRRIQLLEQAARLLYKEWFVHLRFPGHEHVKVKDGVPDGWEKMALSDLCMEIRELVSPTAFEPDTPYVGLEHMPRRSISLSEWGTAEQVTSSKHRFRENEILFGKIRPYFHKVGIAFTDGVASSDSIVIRPLDGVLMPLVLMIVSSDGFVAVTAQTMKEGSKMPRADWKQMQQYIVPLPSDGLLSMFNSVIEPIIQQLKTLGFANRKLSTARDLLLPRLMNGAVVV
ncbi:restriction endonuclease subunit S [Acidithiobacillus ferrivorans]|uniref:restriction endonuclease subunit S n=1 Tax=Acidithiobacillus ferrivorans TaxID=160808 RepID=UPI001C07A2BE|nr:restriction endonuclease subunit S [Acidithiobacillus ferrivorans]MBU2849665.1 restriction endonuclease subunit S [Acidithiobacillus ferrivorans]